MKVCVIGIGYVGLVTGVCLAEIGHDVICVDKDESKINMLLNGKMPIYEPGLEEIVSRNLKNKTLLFTADIKNAIEKQEVIFICVGTPPLPDGNTNLNYIEEVAKDIGRYINGYKIIANKSTVPIGSGDWVSMVINDNINTSNENKKDKNHNKKIYFDVVSNPEFLREGTAISDTFYPDRIVLGSSSKEAIKTIKKLYEPIINQNFNVNDIISGTKRVSNVPVVETDLISSEMIKYAANSFLATKISFINEIANICEKAGADVKMISKGIGLDNRIGARFLDAGIGWGGSCFPKDVISLTKIAAEYGITTQLLNATINVNNQQRLKVIQKIQEMLKIIKGKIIGVLGVSFKPDTDDTRDSPSITIMNQLINLGAKVKVYDPIIKVNPSTLDSRVIICKSIEETFTCSDLILLATEWEEFKNLDFKRIGKLMKMMNFIDGRNFLDKNKMLSLGYNYVGIGR